MLNANRLLLLVPLLFACSTPGGDSTSSGGSGPITSGGSPGAGGTAPTSGGAPQTGGLSAGGSSGAIGTSGGSLSTAGGMNGGATSGGGTTANGGAAGNAGLPAGGTATGGNSSGGAATGGSGGRSTSGGSGGGATSGGSGGNSKGGSAATGGATTGGSGGSSGVYKPAFIIGADITITLEDEHWGATYTDAGVQKSVEQILKDHGFNFIRINTFVNPNAAGGYATTPTQMPEPFRDLAHTIELAQRVKRIGLGVLLDLHYSDTWTNPGAQPTPAAWASLGIAELETRVHDYTRDAVTQLKAANAMPDMVQIGNEITNGMLWEVGHVKSDNNFTNFARLLKAGISAVRAVDPAIQVMLHIEKCDNTATTKWWLDGVRAQGVAFDIFGQSCYGPAGSHPGYQRTPTEWASTFAVLANDYPNLKFMIAEYSSEQRGANDVMFNLPNKRGLGTFNWDPTRSYESHPNVPLFSTDGAWNKYVAIPSMMALYDKMAVDYGLR